MPTMTSKCTCVYLCAFSNDFFKSHGLRPISQGFFRYVFGNSKFQRLEGLLVTTFVLKGYILATGRGPLAKIWLYVHTTRYRYLNMVD